MKKIVFYIAALLILLTAASGNAYCQAVMTMKTQKEKIEKELVGFWEVIVYWGMSTNKFLK